MTKSTHDELIKEIEELEKFCSEQDWINNVNFVNGINNILTLLGKIKSVLLDQLTPAKADEELKVVLQKLIEEKGYKPHAQAGYKVILVHDIEKVLSEPAPPIDAPIRKTIPVTDKPDSDGLYHNSAHEEKGELLRSGKVKPIDAHEGLVKALRFFADEDNYKTTTEDALWFGKIKHQPRVMIAGLSLAKAALSNPHIVDDEHLVKVAYEAFINQLKEAGWSSCDEKYISYEKAAIKAAIHSIRPLLQSAPTPKQDIAVEVEKDDKVTRIAACIDKWKDDLRYGDDATLEAIKEIING